MVHTYPLNDEFKAKSLTEALRRNPPKMRFTKGMAAAARQMETSNAKVKSVKKSK